MNEENCDYPKCMMGGQGCENENKCDELDYLSPMEKRLREDKCDDCWMTGGYHHQDCKFAPANL